MKPSNKNRRPALAPACIIGLFALAYGGEPPAPPASWVEMGPAGLVVARAVTAQSSCPTITIDTGTLDAQPMPMQARALPSPDFLILVCEAAIPIGTKTATVEGRPLALPKTDPQRIVVIGDTGCRMKKPDSFQSCNNPDAWPFAKVAGSAAAWKPGLVIHVGDYLYREAACPANVPGCAGSPRGDNWAAWNADFFTPAASLLQAAPWIVVRGNHESCLRAGKGWFLLLDPRPAPESCREITEPYSVEAGPQQFLVFDSAAAGGAAALFELTATYESQFAALTALASSHTWLLAHHPLGFDDTESTTLQAATNAALPAGIDLVLSGHAHLFGILSTPRLTQVVVGNSGALLHRKLARTLKKKYPQGIEGTKARTITEFGFVTIERADGAWVWTARDVNGAVLTTCRFDGLAACTP